MRTVVRIYAGEDGVSHIEDVTLPFKPFTDPDGNLDDRTALEAANGVIFRVTPPGFFQKRPTAPRRQYIVTLSGEAEIGASDGTVRRIGAGEILLADDLTGEGHTTRIVGDQPRFAMMVPLGK